MTQAKQQATIEIYVVGSYSNPPKGKTNVDTVMPGGYGAVILDTTTNEIIEKSGYKRNTNLSVYSLILAALEDAFNSGKVYEGYAVKIITNLEWVAKGINGIYKIWEHEDWLDKKGQDRKCAEDWQTLTPYFSKHPWVKAEALKDSEVTEIREQAQQRAKKLAKAALAKAKKCNEIVP